MCMYVFADWRDCEHKQFLGSQHCGLDIKALEHQDFSNYFRESGFHCELCLAGDGKTIDPENVKFYPSTNINVTVITDWKGVKTVIAHPQHRRNCNSLSNAGSEGSYSSITARMCGIDSSSRNKTNDMPIKTVPTESPVNDEMSTTTIDKHGLLRKESPTVGSSSDRRASHDEKDTTDGAEAPISDIDQSNENAIRSGQQVELQKHRALLQSQLKNLPQNVAHLEHSPEMADLAKHRKLLESQLNDLQQHMAYANQPKLIPAKWVQAPIFQPAVPIVLAPQMAHMSAIPVTPAGNTCKTTSSYAPIPSSYKLGMSQSHMCMVVPFPVSASPPPPLQLPIKLKFGSVAPAVTQPRITPSPRISTYFKPHGPSRTQGQGDSTKRTSICSNQVSDHTLLSGDTGRPNQPRKSMPAHRLSLADLMVRFDDRGNRRKESRQRKLGTANGDEGMEMGEREQVVGAVDKEKGVEEEG